MDPRIVVADRFLELTADFAVAAWTELCVFARLQTLPACVDRIHFADARDWMIQRVRIGTRQISFDPCYQRADAFSSAVHNGFIKLGVIMTAEEIEIFTKPTKDGLVFSAWFDGRIAMNPQAGLS